MKITAIANVSKIMRQLMIYSLCLLLNLPLYAGDKSVYPNVANVRNLGKIPNKDTTKIKNFSIPYLKNGEINEIYITTDTFDKIVRYYDKHGKPFAMPVTLNNRKLPDGTIIKEKWYMLDKAELPNESKLVVRIRYPYIQDIRRSGDMDTVYYDNVINMTSIKISKPQ